MQPTDSQIRQAANSGLGNPDTTSMGAPPDNFSGPSTVNMQKLTRQIKMSDYPTGARVEIVQWPFEAVVGSVPVAEWMVGFNDDPGSVQNRLQPVAVFDGAWAGAGYAQTLQVGGLCAYIMKAGESAFPTNQTDVVGPKPPIATVQLLYDKEMLHDNCRMIGGSYEVIDNTASLYQQGSSTTCALDNPTNEQVQANHYWVVGNARLARTAICEMEVLPFGSAADMTKLTKSIVMNNKDGVFAPNRIQFQDNSPTNGVGYNAVFIGPTKIKATNLNNNHIVLSITQTTRFENDSVSLLGTILYQTAYLGKLFKTNTSMTQTTIQGVNAAEYTFNLQRKLVTQCFTSIYSDYFAFAKDDQIPANGVVLEAMVNAMRSAPVAFPSDYNKNGKAFAGMFSSFKKGLGTVAKAVPAPLRTVAKNVAKGVIMTNPIAASAITMAKAAGVNKQLMQQIAASGTKAKKNKQTQAKQQSTQLAKYKL